MTDVHFVIQLPCASHRKLLTSLGIRNRCKRSERNQTQRNRARRRRAVRAAWKIHDGAGVVRRLLQPNGGRIPDGTALAARAERVTAKKPAAGVRGSGRRRRSLRHLSKRLSATRRWAVDKDNRWQSARMQPIGWRSLPPSLLIVRRAFVPRSNGSRADAMTRPMSDPFQLKLDTGHTPDCNHRGMTHEGQLMKVLSRQQRRKLQRCTAAFHHVIRRPRGREPMVSRTEPYRMTSA